MASIAGTTSILDIKQLVEQNLVKERQTLSHIAKRRELYGVAQNDWRSVRSALSDLKTSLADLKSTNNFYSRVATTSNASVVSAAADGQAALSGYTFTDITLAQAATSSGVALGLTGATRTAHNGTDASSGADIDPNALLRSSDSQVSGWEALASGSFTINGAVINYNKDTDTLNTLLSKINSSIANVTATFDQATNAISIQENRSGARTISFGGDTTNVLSVFGIDTGQASQAGANAQWEQTLAEVALANPGSALAGVVDGYFMINNITVRVNTATDSLRSIMNRINDSKAGVAVFYNSESGMLEMTARQTGEDITFGDANNTGDSSGFLAQAFGVDLSGGAVTAAHTPATVTVNGATLHPAGNTLTLNGTTFTLGAELSGGSVTVEVNRDTAKATAALQKFVEKYNSVYDTLTQKSAVGQSLSNDWLANTVLTGMRKAVISGISNPGRYAYLRDIGIDYANGRLSLNNSSLQRAFRDDPESVGMIFGYDADGDGVRNDGGLSNTVVDGLINSLIWPSTGAITKRTDAITNQIEFTRRDQLQIEKKVSRKEKYLMEQYTSLTSQIAELSKTLQWLNQQLPLMNSMAFSLAGVSSTSGSML